MPRMELRPRLGSQGAVRVSSTALCPAGSTGLGHMEQQGQPPRQCWGGDRVLEGSEGQSHPTLFQSWSSTCVELEARSVLS